MKRAYYNENDRHMAAWLRELIREGLIADGDVDERSICDVQGSDLEGYTQCHFFAGLGAWSYALRLAGWPDDRPVLTGSCPCQPYSDAGKQKAQADARHLWPEMFRINCEHPFDVLLGEQVTGAIKHGWLDGICDDLEGKSYAVGSVVLPASCKGAPHIRHRIFWVADKQCAGVRLPRPGADGCTQGGMQSTDGKRERFWSDARTGGTALAGGLGDNGGSECGSGRGPWDRVEATKRSESLQHAHVDGGIVGLVNDIAPGLEGFAGNGDDGNKPGRITADPPRSIAAPSTAGFWSEFDFVYCRDEKYRRVEPGTFPLVDGTPARVVRLRGYGNAIVPQVAAAFIEAYLEAASDLVT